MKTQYLVPLAVLSFTLAIALPAHHVLYEDHGTIDSNVLIDFFSDSTQDDTSPLVSGNALDDSFEPTLTNEQHTINFFNTINVQDINSNNIPQNHHHDLPTHTDKTTYELLTSSKSTTILAAIINDDKYLIDTLNTTNANITVFAPTDSAFAKIPKDVPRASKEFIRKAILYHVLLGLYPAHRIFDTRTLPTFVNEPALGTDLPQRLAVRTGDEKMGLTVNSYSHVDDVDITTSNGLIHTIDSILIPPPQSLTLLNIVPATFSSFTLALLQTGLSTALDTSAHHGATIFAPTNKAFQALGLKINGFLFSNSGRKYLRALMKYHIVLNRTLYSDVFYNVDGGVDSLGEDGFVHLDLPTLLVDHSLAIDVARRGSNVSMRVNGFQSVAFTDALAEDGVLHLLDTVLIPPRKLTDSPSDASTLTIEELKEHLSDWVAEEDDAGSVHGEL